MGKINDIYIVNEQEDEGITADVTKYPVEKGSPITDHVQPGDKTITVTGSLLGDRAEKDYLKLKEYAETGKMVSYKGRIYTAELLISSVSKTYTTIKNGMGISVTLVRVKRAKTPWVQKKKTSSGSKQPAGNKKSSVVYITVKKGDCYWKWWKKYGTSIAQLRKWNGWPDRRIPIGARARVK